MESLSANQRIMQDPLLRRSLEQAQTREQKLHVLKRAGISNEEVENAAATTEKIATALFCEKGPCFD